MKQLKHFIFAGIIVAILTAVLGYLFTQIQFFPPAASMQAEPIDELFVYHFWVIAFLYSLIVGFLLYSIVVFRRKDGDESEGDYIEGSTTLEITWTIIPLIVVLFFSFLGGRALAETMRVDPNAMEVEVRGAQWSWRFEYPEFDVVSTELVLPVDKQVLLKLSSADVIHSFWVPEFRVKQDLLPGDLVRELRITPTETGEYKVRCAELCGAEHANMRAPVLVMSQADFDTWIADNQAAVSDDPVERGRVWAQQFGCLSCHSTDGTVIVGPSWQGLWGTEETLADGSTVTVDEAYIIESIQEPNAKIVDGFQPDVMNPSIYEGITDDQISDIIEFIKTLE